jgi:cytochrome c oxidase subunit II
VRFIRSVPRQGERVRQVRRWLPRAGLLAGLLVLTTGCSPAWENLGMRQPVTKQGLVTLSLWQGSWIAALAVGVVVWGAIVWAIIFFRKRSDQVPRQVRYNLPIEMLYTVLPFVLIGVLFYFTAKDENYIDKLSPHPQVVVNVTGFQWSWAFQYPQYPVTSKDPNCTGAGVCELGKMWTQGTPDTLAATEKGLPLLEIPENETVRFNLYSIDVIHSFWIVPFEFKRDVIPGHPNHFEVTPISTGTFLGRCTELCGLYHSRMLFTVKIVTPAQFRTWISGQQAIQDGQTLSAASGGAS